MSFTDADRERIIADVCARLSEGEPLAVICRTEGYPSRVTIYDWRDADPAVALRIARAREVGFDAIAEDAMAIADETSRDTIDRDGRDVANAEWISRSKLRVETRLKLLAKWDPKRYGDRQLVGSDPENPLPTGITVRFVDVGQ